MRERTFVTIPESNEDGSCSLSCPLWLDGTVHSCQADGPCPGAGRHEIVADEKVAENLRAREIALKAAIDVRKREIDILDMKQSELKDAIVLLEAKAREAITPAVTKMANEVLDELADWNLGIKTLEHIEQIMFDAGALERRRYAR